MYICVCSMGGGTQTYCLWLEAAELQKIRHIVSHSWLLLGSNPTGKWIHDLCKLIVIPSKSNMQGWRFTSSQRSVFKFKCSPPHLFPIEFTLLWCHAITCHAMQPSLYRRTSHQHWRVAKLPIILYAVQQNAQRSSVPNYQLFDKVCRVCAPCHLWECLGHPDLGHWRCLDFPSGTARNWLKGHLLWT